MKRLFYLIMLIALTSCTQNNKTEKIIDLSPNELNLVKLKDIIKSYQIIPLTNQKEFIAHKIRKVQSTDNLFFILDEQDKARQILVFDNKGVGLSRINNKGRGPGEYLQIADFDIIPEKRELLIADAGNLKILKFSFLGDYIDSKKVNHFIKNINYLPSENGKPMILTSSLKSFTAEKEKNYELFLFDEDIQLHKKYFPYLKANIAGMGNGFHFYESEKAVNYYPTFSNETYQINAEGILLPKNKFKFPVDILPPEQITDHMIGKVPLDKYIYFVSYFEHNEAIVFTYSWGGEDYIASYNKDSEKSKVVKVPKLPSCSKCSSFRLVGTTTNQLINYADAKATKELLNIIDPTKKKCSNPESLAKLKVADENDNSILLLLSVNAT